MRYIDDNTAGKPKHLQHTTLSPVPQQSPDPHAPATNAAHKPPTRSATETSTSTKSKGGPQHASPDAQPPTFAIFAAVLPLLHSPQLSSSSEAAASSPSSSPPPSSLHALCNNLLLPPRCDPTQPIAFPNSFHPSKTSAAACVARRHHPPPPPLYVAWMQQRVTYSPCFLIPSHPFVF